ncbi:MAG: hypothetical protein GY719_30510 [bacterium]|nr:hypothetical protein [bacterium]
MKLLAAIRRDDALRWLPLWISAGAGVALLLSGLYAYRAYGDPASGPATLTLVLWCAVAPYLAFGQVRRRCSRFDLALPLSSRRLWLAHIAAVLLAGAMVLAVSAALVVSISGLSGRFQGLPEPRLDALHLAVHLAVGLGLAVAVLEAARPTLAEIPIDRGRVLFTVASLGGILGMLWLLSALPLFWALGPLGLALALGLRTYRSLPPAFSLVPLAADPGPAVARRSVERDWAAAVTGRRAAWRRNLDLVRWVAGGPIAWFAYPMIFFAGMLIADLLRAWTGEPDMTVQNLLMAIYVLLTFSGLMTARLPLFDPLPVSRRLLLAALVLPNLAALILGYGAGRIAVAALDEPRDLVEMAEWKEGYFVRVPARYLEIAWDGRPPELGAPWGEGLEPMLFPLYRGGRAGLYSPFPVSAGSSPELWAFQIRRAVEAVYGRSIPEAEIRERYLEVDGEGRVVPRGEGLTLLADHPGLEPRDTGPAFPVVLLLVVSSWLLLFSIVLRSYRADIGDRARLGVFWGLVALVFAIMGLHLALAVTDVVEPWVTRGFLEIAIRHLGESWHGTLAAWLASALALLGGFLVALASFQRTELPARLVLKKGLLDLTGGSS